MWFRKKKDRALLERIVALERALKRLRDPRLGPQAYIDRRIGAVEEKLNVMHIALEQLETKQWKDFGFELHGLKHQIDGANERCDENDRHHHKLKKYVEGSLERTEELANRQTINKEYLEAKLTTGIDLINRMGMRLTDAADVATRVSLIEEAMLPTIKGTEES